MDNNSEKIESKEGNSSSHQGNSKKEDDLAKGIQNLILNKNSEQLNEDFKDGNTSSNQGNSKTDNALANESTTFPTNVGISPESRTISTDVNDDPERISVESLASQLKCISLSYNVLKEISIYGIASYIKETPCKNIITMVGAGISTAAGIPDFRSRDTGIYYNLQKYGLPYPQAMFEIDHFLAYPEPFYQLAANLLPGDYRPTKSHCFIKLLEDKGVLLCHFTQNIDNLDRLVGISEERLVEAHGTFTVSHCTGCRHKYGLDWLRRQIKRKRVPHCVHCNKLVKPDIVFFGENLPQKFYNTTKVFEKCDLLIIMGSSLEVEPFASLASRTSAQCPRLLINLTPVGENINFQFGSSKNLTDVLWIGECDSGCQLLADELGWGDDLLKLYNDTRFSSSNQETAETSC